MDSRNTSVAVPTLTCWRWPGACWLSHANLSTDLRDDAHMVKMLDNVA